MSEKKDEQIEGMIEVLYARVCGLQKEDCKKIAEIYYNQGYRKRQFDVEELKRYIGDSISEEKIDIQNYDNETKMFYKGKIRGYSDVLDEIKEIEG